MAQNRFGADFWSAGRQIDNSAINNGGYFDRERLENPPSYDRYGEPEGAQYQHQNTRLEFPYGY